MFGMLARGGRTHFLQFIPAGRLGSTEGMHLKAIFSRMQSRHRAALKRDAMIYSIWPACARALVEWQVASVQP